MALNEGDTAPDFTLATDGGGKVQLSALKGKKVVVYFYPKDDTPGCTTESCNFRDDHPKFQKEGVEIIGISKDSVESHDKFKAKFDLNFTLAADPDLEAIKAYEVWVEKNMYGKKSMGVERSTFLIDADGKIARAWRKVKVDGHADEVFEAAKGI
ncbi:MAG: peroxiredoxin Q/BCP [Alphaproteobacteria bacterium]|jgi:peroxiredoxin Q/BCP